MTLSPMPKWIKITFGYACAPIISLFFAVARVLEWWDSTTGPTVQGEWQRRYAWLPTRLGAWNGPLVWLEPIERARCWGNAILYRRPGDTSIRTPWEIADDEI